MSSEDSLIEVIGFQFRPTETAYSEKDAARYALAIGASQDPLDAGDLQYSYELNTDGFNCFPTFAVTFPLQTLEQIADIPHSRLNLLDILHGEHYLELFEPLPARGTFSNQATISQVYDKGSGALILVDILTTDDTGRAVVLNRASIFVRGRGGFGGDRGPSSQVDSAPERQADEIVREKTAANQALQYRLASGDMNPLHVDARFAALFGYERPILHGLCTYGYAARAVIRSFADNNAVLFESMKARFTRHLFPGETIATEMWRDTATRILFQCRAVERDEVVLTNGVLTLKQAQPVLQN